MSKSALTIIIPTYNRKNVLLKSLEAYKRQTDGNEILELLVVDDGSTDGTDEAVERSAPGSLFPIRVLRQENRGLAAARNLGIRNASGELLLFVDDDIIPSFSLVAEHIAGHRRQCSPSIGILGRVRWSPDIRPTPFMEWLGQDGALFGFGRLSPGMAVGLDCCYFCNTSVKKSFLLEHGLFDETFRAYGYEDLELGCRLANQGFRMIYNDAATGDHYKRLTYADVCRREELVFASKAELDTTEGGRYLKNRASSKKLIPLKTRMRKTAARAVAPFLAPLTPLLDTQLPLPWVVYRILYHHHVVPKAKARFEQSRQPCMEAKGERAR